MIPEPLTSLTKSQNGQGTGPKGTLIRTGYVFVKFDENLIESPICCIAQFCLTNYIAVHINRFTNSPGGPPDAGHPKRESNDHV